MRIEAGNSDELVLEELGSRLARRRLERNMTQARLAHEAGVSKATVERVEAGQAVKSTSLIRLLRALGQLEALDKLMPKPLPSPIERIRLDGRQRQRAIGSRASPPEEHMPWAWGTEDDG